MYHRGAFLGCPGSGKSTMGLSYPGVEQHVWGSSEEDTAKNFTGRKDILPPVKFDWFDCLTPEEQSKFTDEKVTESEVATLMKKGRARNVARYRRYLYKLKNDLNAGLRPELKTVFLDNFTPFSQDFQDYVEVVWEKELVTQQGNFNSIAFAIKFANELTDFLRLFVSLKCHTVMSCHIAMTLDEETAAKADFMNDTAKRIKYPKEWQPLVMGKAKYVFAGIFTWAFYVWCEETPGMPNKYYAKLEADSASVGIAKGRIQPFDRASKIEIPRGNFYEFLESAINSKLTKGV